MVGQRVKSLSPFEHAGRYVHLSEDHAFVWVWDEDRRTKALSEISARFSPLEEHFSKLTPVPETLFQRKGTDNQVVRDCVDGFDLQTWRSGLLIDSEWRENSDPNIDSNVRDSGNWIEVESQHIPESAYWRLGFLCLVIVLLFQVGAFTGQLVRETRLDSQLESERKRMSLTMPVRSLSQEVREANELLNDWMGEPSQLSLIADFDQRMPESAQLTAWKYEDRVLEVTVVDEELDNRRYIEGLSEAPQFENVRVTPGASSGSVMVTLEVKNQ